MEEFAAHVYEADSIFYEGPLESLILPSEDGMVGILAHHSNLIMAIVPGIMRYKPPGQDYLEAAVSGGFLRISDNDVLVLVEAAEHPDEIDEERVRQHEIRAREALLHKQSIHEYNLAEARLRRAISRMNLASRRR